MGKKKYVSRIWGQFIVAGVTYSDPGMRTSRLGWIRQYVRYGAMFKLKREPDNEYDPNAIKVQHVLKKSGRRITVGYVPATIAAKWAPLMDAGKWDPDLYFFRMLLIETEKQAEKWHQPIGTITGLVVRYSKR